MPTDYTLPPKPGATCRACGYYKREQAPTDRQPVCCQCHGCACEECFTTTEHRHAQWEARADQVAGTHPTDLDSATKHTHALIDAIVDSIHIVGE